MFAYLDMNSDNESDKEQEVDEFPELIAEPKDVVEKIQNFYPAILKNYCKIFRSFRWNSSRHD